MSDKTWSAEEVGKAAMAAINYCSFGADPLRWSRVGTYLAATLGLPLTPELPTRIRVSAEGALIDQNGRVLEGVDWSVARYELARRYNAVAEVLEDFGAHVRVVDAASALPCVIDILREGGKA